MRGNRVPGRATVRLQVSIFCTLVAASVLSLSGRSSAEQPSPDGPRWRDLDEVIRRWHSSDARLRAAATRAAGDRWAEWTPAEIARMQEVSDGPDRESSQGAQLALERVRRLRGLVKEIGPEARSLVSFLTPAEDERSQVVVRTARSLAADGVIPAVDAERLEALARAVSPDADFRPLPERIAHMEALWSPRDLAELLQDPLPEKRAQAIREIARRGESGELGVLVEDRLKDESGLVRRAAAAALIRLRRMDSVRLLAWELSGEDPEVVRNLILTMRRLGPQELSDRMAPVLRADDPFARLAAARAMAAFRDPEGATLLVPLLTDRIPHIVEVALEAVGDMRPPGALDAVGQMLEAPRPRSRAVAARLAGRLGARVCSKRLVLLLDDLFPEVRAGAAEGLGRLAEVDRVEVLVRASHDPEAMVRSSAIVALGRIRSPAGYARIRSALSDEDESVRADASRALAAARVPGARELLRRMALDDGSIRVASAATLGLGLLGDPEDSDVLLIQATRNSPELRIATAEAAALAGARQLIPQLASLSLDERLEVDAAAFAALGRLAAPEDLWSLWPVRTRSIQPALTAGALAFVDLLPPPSTPAGDDAILRCLQDLATFDDEDVSCSGRIGLLRLGRLDVPACRRLLEDANGGEEGLAVSAVEALVTAYEPATQAILCRQLSLDGEIASIHDLASVLREAGLHLESHERVIFEGRVPAGLRVTPAWLLWRAGLRGAYVVEGNRVRILTPGLAVAHWRARLAAMKEK